MRSKVRMRMLVIEMMRYEEGSDRGPFLKMPKALAVFQELLRIPCFQEALKRTHKVRWTMAGLCLRKEATRLSGPGAVEVLACLQARATSSMVKGRSRLLGMLPMSDDMVDEMHSSNSRSCLLRRG